jgi:hypothetical protein
MLIAECKIPVPVCPDPKGLAHQWSLLTGEQARPVLFFMLRSTFTKEEILGQA